MKFQQKLVKKETWDRATGRLRWVRLEKMHCDGDVIENKEAGSLGPPLVDVPGDFRKTKPLEIAGPD